MAWLFSSQSFKLNIFNMHSPSPLRNSYVLVFFKIKRPLKKKRPISPSL